MRNAVASQYDAEQQGAYRGDNEIDRQTSLRCTLL